MHKRNPLLVASLLLAAGPVVAADGPPQQSSAPKLRLVTGQAALAGPVETDHTVTADFGALIADSLEWPASGFLLSYHMTGPGNPPHSLIRPTRPQTWRLGWFEQSVYNQLASLGVRRIHLVVSECWGYPTGRNCYGPTPWLRPYEHRDEWKAYVEALAAAVAAANLHPELEVQFDVWNEPDLAWFWDGTWNDFLTTYVDAWNAITSLIPDAVVAGPSVANTSWASTKLRLELLLELCAAGSCRVNVLSYHENNSDHPALIQSHLAEAHDLVADYAAAGVEEISINEHNGNLGHLAPGHIIASYHYLEAGGADSAVRACWHDSQGSSECGNDTLDGLLARTQGGGFAPRSAWWAAWAYGLLGRERFATGTSHYGIVAIAGSSASAPELEPGSRLVLLAYSHLAGLNGGQEVLLEMSGLDRDSVPLRVLSIPYTGEAVLDEPILLYENQVPTTNGRLGLSFPGMTPAQLIVVILRPSEVFRDGFESGDLSAWSLAIP